MDVPKRQDVWEALILGGENWTGRVKLLHFKAHTDTKRDKEGGKRKVTQLEEENEPTR